MVLKNAKENKPFNTLPPAVPTNENDAIIARYAIIEKNLKKKKEPARFAGGIWDIDDKMDTTESPDNVNRDSFRLQLNTLLQSESPYFEIDDKMDTVENRRSDSGESPFVDVPVAKETGVGTTPKLPEVTKKELEKMKKKSEDELSLERSKRCRTSSKTEVYPLQSAIIDESFMEAESEVQDVMSKESYDGADAKPILEVNNLPSQSNLESPAVCKESQIVKNQNKMKCDAGYSAETKSRNVYQKEIDVLRKVASIFESLGMEGNDQMLKSYAEEVQHLEKICCILKTLQQTRPPSNRASQVDKSVADEILAGEAAFTANDHGVKNNSMEVTMKDEFKPMKNEETALSNQRSSGFLEVDTGQLKSCDKKSDEVLVDNAVDKPEVLSKKSEADGPKDDAWIEQIIKGTLPWKPAGSPPPRSAFSAGSTVQSTVVNPSIAQSLKSVTVDSLPETSADKTLKVKARSQLSLTEAMDSDIFEKLVNEASSRGSPPPMPAFSKSAKTSPLRTVDKSSLIHKSATSLIQVTKSDTMVKTKLIKVEPLKVKDDSLPIPPPVPSPKYVPPHLRSKSPWGSNTDIPRKSEAFKAEVKTTLKPLKSSSKTRDAYSPYPSKERKMTDTKNPIKNTSSSSATLIQHVSDSTVNANAFSLSGQYIPPPVAPKTNDNLSRNQQTKGFETETWANWRRDRSSPTKLNDLSTPKNDQRAKIDDNTKLAPKSEKPLNVKTDSSSSKSKSCENLDTFKTNRASNSYEKRQPPKKFGADPRQKFPQLSQDAMISLKIFDENNAVVDELMLPLNQLVQRRKKFPSLSEVIPSTGEKDKELKLNGEAVKVFLRCVFSATELRIPGWEIALEVYYLAKKYGIVKLKEQCKEYFEYKPIQPNQVQGIVQIARKYEITEVLKNSSMFAEVQAHNIPNAAMQATTKENSCIVSCTVSMDPSEYSIPVEYVKENGLGSRRESDITNDITFKAKSGTFCLTGLHIKLEAEMSDLKKNVKFFCDVHKGNRKVFDLEKEKPLNTLMVIDFNHRLIVEPGETATISVVMEDACARMCHRLLSEKEFGRCADGSFEVSFASDRKSEARHPLFFVEKFLYTFEGQKN